MSSLCYSNSCTEYCCNRYGYCLNYNSPDPYQRQCYYYYSNSKSFPNYAIAILVSVGAAICVFFAVFFMCRKMRRARNQPMIRPPMQPFPNQPPMQNGPIHFNVIPPASSQNTLSPQAQYQMAQGLAFNSNQYDPYPRLSNSNTPEVKPNPYFTGDKI